MTPPAPCTKHTIKLTFDDSPEDQALYAALRESSHQACREPLPRQVKYLLEQAMGRPATRPATLLRLIPGGAEAEPA